jgi:hypothetical protein
MPRRYWARERAAAGVGWLSSLCAGFACVIASCFRVNRLGNCVPAAKALPRKRK